MKSPLDDHTMTKLAQIAFIVSLLILTPRGLPLWAEDDEPEQVIELTGLTIVGAKESPKSLILVPWKDSNIDVTTRFGSLVDSIEMKPIDRETLQRILLFDNLVKSDLEKRPLAPNGLPDESVESTSETDPSSATR